MPELIPLERLANVLACLQSSTLDPIDLFFAHVHMVHLANYQAAVESHRLVPYMPFPYSMLVRRAREIRKSGTSNHNLALRTAISMRVACMNDEQSHSYLTQGSDMLLELVCQMVISSHLLRPSTLQWEETYEAHRYQI